MTSRAAPHGFVTKSIHWLSAGLLAFGYFKGLDSVRQLADPTTFWVEIIFALTIGLLFAVRWFWIHKVAGASRLPNEAPKWERFAAGLVQKGLYASVFGIVGSGLGIAAAYVTPALDGWFLNATVGLHEATLAVMPILLLVHIAGALWHKVIRRDGVLESMTGKLPV